MSKSKKSKKSKNTETETETKKAKTKKAKTKKAEKNTKTKTKKHERRGENHHRAKLADSDIEMIRKKYKEGVSQAKLARHYEVSVTYMHKIVHGLARA